VCNACQEVPINIRTRKLIGTIGLLALVAAWSLMAMAFAQNPYLQSSRVLQFAYYVIVGIGWVLPAMPLVAWMVRVSPRRGDGSH
jgi:hypothetical protein